MSKIEKVGTGEVIPEEEVQRIRKLKRKLPTVFDWKKLKKEQEADREDSISLLQEDLKKDEEDLLKEDLCSKTKRKPRRDIL